MSEAKTERNVAAQSLNPKLKKKTRGLTDSIITRQSDHWTPETKKNHLRIMFPRDPKIPRIVDVNIGNKNKKIQIHRSNN